MRIQSNLVLSKEPGYVKFADGNREHVIRGYWDVNLDLGVSFGVIRAHGNDAADELWLLYSLSEQGNLPISFWRGETVVLDGVGSVGGITRLQANATAEFRLIATQIFVEG